jgi:methylated-DNA-[protein]-cysteine S-methyltransferase
MSPTSTLVLPWTPVGPLTLVASPAGLQEVRFGATPGAPAPGDLPTGPAGASPTSPFLARAAEALEAYFAGASDPFQDLPLALERRTPFQQTVYRVLRDIPRGRLLTYGEVARDAGSGSPRAVGQAVGANPLPIIVPCHRVVAASRRLGGFSGGLERKVTLLELEGLIIQGEGFGARVG